MPHKHVSGPKEQKMQPREARRHRKRRSRPNAESASAETGTNLFAADAAANAVDDAAGATSDDGTKAAQAEITAAGGAPDVTKAAAVAAEKEKDASTESPLETRA